VIKEEDLPAKIFIPKIKRELSVSPTKVVDDQWIVSKTGVSYLLGSGLPGRKGNVVIFGHNWRRLFGPLRWLKPGDEIRVTTRGGQEFFYQVAEIKTVSPEAVEVLAPTEDFTLTLYTCAGFLDTKRLVVRAKLKPRQK